MRKRPGLILTGRSANVAGLASSAVIGLLLALPPSATGEAVGVVRAILFASPTCPHCHKVLKEVLPPLVIRYGGRFEVGVVSTATPTGRSLYWAAHQRFGIQQRGVPLLVVGDVALVGSEEIPQRLPGLIASYLDQGGIDWPEIPGLAEVLAQSFPPASEPTPTAPGAVPAPPGSTAATSAGPPSAPVPTPTPLPTPTPRLAVEPPPATGPPPSPARTSARASVAHDATLGPRSPDANPGPHLPTPATPRPQPTPVVVSPPPAVPEPAAETGGDVSTTTAAGAAHLIPLGAEVEPGLSGRILADPRGNGLAILVLAGMAIVVLRSAGILGRRDRAAARSGVDWLNPLLALAGLGVATYLAYIEVSEIEAVCGPVGDCNTVQRSEYARLFGVLPIGVLGVLGFTAILTAWGVRRVGRGRTAAWADVVLLVLTGFGTLFSIYLTFLEPFVIGATCLWCLSSAVIMTVLYRLALVPGRAGAAAVRARPTRGLSRQSV